MDAKLSIEARRFKKVREEPNHTQQYFAEILGKGITESKMGEELIFDKYLDLISKMKRTPLVDIITKEKFD